MLGEKRLVGASNHKMALQKALDVFCAYRAKSRASVVCCDETEVRDGIIAC